MEKLDQILADMPRRCAVAQLVGYCEALCATGTLDETRELTLRGLVAQTLTAFNMPSKAEREAEAA